ncbi:MAG: hypothetical protein K1X47_00180 [Cyclobacteriaceae bacterium]|nr:hypothetical protein [Cyclobacteriaceae bacterium]
MSATLFYYFQITSTLSAVLPLALGMWVQRREVRFRWMLSFLALGLFTDLLGWAFYLSNFSRGNLVIRDIYSLLEFFFVCGMLHAVVQSKVVRRILKYWIVVLIPLWVVGVWWIEWNVVARTTSQVVIAFASGFAILEMVEKSDNPYGNWLFWVLLGFFFYFFCTFFFMSLIATQMGIQIWYLHNFVNITTNLFYFYGFWRTRNNQSL